MADMSAAMTDISVNRPRVVEHDAREIGGLFRKAKSSAVESVRCLIQAGHKLKAKQKKLSRGQWIPWLEENERTLGFGTRTAQLLIKAATKYEVNCVLGGPEEALQISREIWGNKALASKSTTNNDEQPEEDNEEATHEQPEEEAGEAEADEAGDNEQTERMRRATKGKTKKARGGQGHAPGDGGKLLRTLPPPSSA
jgi:hypothetical protein